MTDIAEATAERLRAFSDALDLKVVNHVADTMARHAGGLALGGVDMVEMSDKLRTIPHGGPVPLHVLDMIPDGSYDERSALVVGLMWGQGLTPGIAHRMSLLSACMPNDRIVALATPAGSAPRWGSLAPVQRAALRSGDLSPLTGPLLGYLCNTGVRNVAFVGASFGADEIAAASARAADYDIEVRQAVAIEPTSIFARPVGRLIRDFCDTRRSTAPHVGASGDPRYDRLQQAELAIFGLARLAVSSLVRPTSWAAASYLAGGQFERQMKAGLDSQANMTAQIVWGTHSGLAPYEHAQRLAGTLQAQYGGRVSILWLDGLGHGLCSDLALTTVLALQGLRRTVAA